MMKRIALVLAAAWLAACASAPRRPAGTDELVFPTVRAGELSAEDVRKLREGWDRLLAGENEAALRDFERLRARRPASPAATTAAGWARLRAGQLDTARELFARALQGQDDYVPALAGSGAVALRQARFGEALTAYRRAATLSPEDPRLRARLAEVKLQATEKAVAAAREALERQDVAEGLRQYHMALDAAPELAGVRLELAELLVSRGQAGDAAEVLRADPLGDRAVLMRLGALSEQLQDWSGALSAYQRVLARDGRDAEAARRAAAARATLELSQMPEEYRRILDAPRLTRAELAALLSVKLGTLERLPVGQPGVAVDISGSWAREHVLRMLSLGVMEVYPNHTFQPGATVRRGDLAAAVGRVLDLRRWPAGAPPAISDMSRSNLFYAAAARVVAAGLMDLSAGGAFEPWRPVSGRDAADVIEATARLLGP